MKEKKKGEKRRGVIVEYMVILEMLYIFVLCYLLLDSRIRYKLSGVVYSVYFWFFNIGSG